MTDDEFDAELARRKAARAEQASRDIAVILSLELDDSLAS